MLLTWPYYTGEVDVELRCLEGFHSRSGLTDLNGMLKRDKAGPSSRYIGGIDTIETWHLSYRSLCLEINSVLRPVILFWKSTPFTWRELSMGPLSQHDLAHEGKIATRLGFSGKPVHAEWGYSNTQRYCNPGGCLEVPLLSPLNYIVQSPRWQ